MKKSVYIILLSCLFCSLKLNAQGYRAGDITYTWISGYTYQIKLTTFTSISGTNLSDPCQDTLCFGDGTGAVVFRSNGFSGLCSPPALNGTPLTLNIKLNEYVTTHTYPGPGNYMMCFQDHNRNSGIINIPNSVNQTMSLNSFLVIPTFGSIKNSSPVFANLPLASGCLNNGCFTYNPSATDADGDSLSYEIIPCKGNSVAVPGYTYPATGLGGIFTINPVTGLLTWCNPQLAGDYNVIVKITEWRKDDAGDSFIVGYVERDTQLSVGICTGINETTETENIISVSPNPVTENLTVTLNQNNGELFTIELIDVTGRKIKTIANNQSLSKQNKVALNLENIQTGIYFLQFIGSNNTSITKKIIKQ